MEREMKKIKMLVIMCITMFAIVNSAGAEEIKKLDITKVKEGSEAQFAIDTMKCEHSGNKSLAAKGYAQMKKAIIKTEPRFKLLLDQEDKYQSLAICILYVVTRKGYQFGDNVDYVLQHIRMIYDVDTVTEAVNRSKKIMGQCICIILKIKTDSTADEVKAEIIKYRDENNAEIILDVSNITQRVEVIDRVYKRKLGIWSK